MELMQLNEYVKNELDMELIDKYTTSVEQEIDSWEQAVKDGKIPDECIEDNKRTIEELRKHIGYSCLYALA